MIKGRTKKHSVDWQGEYSSKFGGAFVGGTEKENIERGERKDAFRIKKSHRQNEDYSIDRKSLDRGKIAAAVFSNRSDEFCHGIMVSRHERLVLYDMFNDSLEEYFNKEKPLSGFSFRGLLIFYHIYIGPTTFCKVADGNRAINVPQQMLDAANARARNGKVLIQDIRKMRNVAVTNTMEFSYKDLKFSMDPYHFLDVVKKSFMRPPDQILAGKGTWSEQSRREYTLKVRSYIKVLSNKVEMRNPKYKGGKKFTLIRGASTSLDEFNMLKVADAASSPDDAKRIKDAFYTAKNQAAVKLRVEARQKSNAEKHQQDRGSGKELNDNKERSRARRSGLKEILASISLKEAISRICVSAILNSNLGNDSILVIFSYVSPFLWYRDLHLYRYIRNYLMCHGMDDGWGDVDDEWYAEADPPEDFFSIFDDVDINDQRIERNRFDDAVVFNGVPDDFHVDGDLNGVNGEFTGSDDVAHRSRMVNREPVGCTTVPKGCKTILGHCEGGFVTSVEDETLDTDIPELVDVSVRDSQCLFCGNLHGRGGCMHSHGHKRVKNMHNAEKRIAERLKREKRESPKATRSQLIPCDSHCYCLKRNSFHVTDDDKREIFCFIAAKGDVDDVYHRLISSISSVTSSDRAMLLLREKNGIFTDKVIHGMWDDWHNTGVGLSRQPVEVEANVDRCGNTVEDLHIKFDRKVNDLYVEMANAAKEHDFVCQDEISANALIHDCFEFDRTNEVPISYNPVSSGRFAALSTDSDSDDCDENSSTVGVDGNVCLELKSSPPQGETRSIVKISSGCDLCSLGYDCKRCLDLTRSPPKGETYKIEGSLANFNPYKAWLGNDTFRRGDEFTDCQHRMILDLVEILDCVGDLADGGYAVEDFDNSLVPHQNDGLTCGHLVSAGPLYIAHDVKKGPMLLRTLQNFEIVVGVFRKIREVLKQMIRVCASGFVTFLKGCARKYASLENVSRNFKECAVAVSSTAQYIGSSVVKFVEKIDTIDVTYVPPAPPSTIPPPPPEFGLGFLLKEKRRKVNIGLNLKIEARPLDDPVYKRVSVSIFKYLMYTKTKHSSLKGGEGQCGNVDSTEALGRSYIRAGICSFADMLLFLPYITACTLSTVSGSADVVADDISSLRRWMWGKACSTEKDRRLSNEQYDLLSGCFNYSEEVDIYSELFNLLWSSYAPLSATGSSVTLTNVFTHMPGKVGEKVAQLCTEKCLTGYMMYENSVTLLNTIIYFVQTKTIQFAKGQGALTPITDQVKSFRGKV